MKVLILFIYFYTLDKIWWYYQIKHDCKKYKANCEMCSNFLCPRFKILHQEEDYKIINEIKSKFKNIFNKKNEEGS